MSHPATKPLSPCEPVNARLLEEEILPHVFKPARYLGLEQGAYRKPFHRSAVTMAVAFPDLYEIGFSNYGLKLLYSLVNQQKDYMCDRVYAPAPDFKEKLAEYAFPLYGVETMQPLLNFDLLAFSLQYELNYTTVFGMLEAAQIPFRAAERNRLAEQTGAHWPLLIAGGPGSANPMPMAPFFDAFIIGDGEEVLLEILDLIDQGKKERLSRAQLLARLARIDGVYVPGLTEKAYKRIVDIAEKPVELAPLIPLIGAVHDRITIEARRGCDRMCRFCQPCFINLPVREQTIDNIKKSALREIEKTGYEECSLLSLSIADYSYFKPLIMEVAEALEEENVSLSLPSQRADRFSLEVAEAVQSVRKSTLTFAPEAGTPRLRDVINKNLSDTEIMDAVTTAYRAGWNKVKLYFIIGLPTETHEDLDGIVDIVHRMKEACYAMKRDPDLSLKDHLDINVTLSNFVPKPHTPFQWFPQDTMDVLRQKIRYLKDKFRGMRGVKLNFTDPEISKLEAVISRAGEELADVVEAAYREGAYLDAWDDVENFQRWFKALTAHGIDVESYTHDRCTNPDEPLPWDCVDVGLSKHWLKAEYDKANLAGSTTPCFDTCSVCGVCATYGTQPKFTDSPDSKKKKAEKALLEEAKVSALKKEPVCKLRLKMEKRGQLRFISHLDWLRMIHRAIARAKVPVAYSQGFNPKPRVSFGPALPLFTESYGEFVDVDLTERISEAEARAYIDRLNPYLPEGGGILDVKILPMQVSSIDKSIRFMKYAAAPAIVAEAGNTTRYAGQTTCNEGVKEYTIADRVRFLAAQTALPIEVEIGSARSKIETKVLDLAPYLTNLEANEDGTIQFQIQRLKGADGVISSVKPSWVLGLINPDIKWSVARTEIHLEVPTAAHGN